MPKKIVKIIAILGISLYTGLFSLNFAFAQDSASDLNQPVGGISEAIRNIGDQTNLPNYDVGHAKEDPHPGASTITSIVYYSMDIFRYVLGAIAVMMLVMAGINLVIAGKEVSETAKKEQEAITSILIGIIIVFISEEVIRNVFFGQEGEVYRSPTDLVAAATRGSTMLAGVVDFMMILIPILAVLFIIIAGFRMMVSAGDPQEYAKAQKQAIYAAASVIVAGLAEYVIYKIVYPNTGNSIVDAQEFNRFIVKITNYVSGFISTLAVIMIIYAGYLYTMSSGGEETSKANKIIVGSVIGLLIAMGAFALVNTLVKIEPNTPTSLVQQTTTNNLP